MSGTPDPLAAIAGAAAEWLTEDQCVWLLDMFRQVEAADPDTTELILNDRGMSAHKKMLAMVRLGGALRRLGTKFHTSVPCR